MRSFPLVALLCVMSSLTVNAQVGNAQKITTFDVPNGTETTPTGISTSGNIVGFYGDTAAGRVRGFVRDSRGAITTFDAPGSNSSDTFSTAPTAISQSGSIVGYSYTGLPVVQPGFIRNTKGAFASVSLTGAWNVFPQAINSQGEVVGYYYDLIGNWHAFLLNPNGTFYSFDQTLIGDTFSAIYDVNDLGQSTGFYDDLNTRKQVGFLRQANGSITTFNPLNATDTFPVAINLTGTITGDYLDTDVSYQSHGFVRNPNGSITSFDVPNASDTHPVAIDSKGEIAGYYTDTNNTQHGFVRNIYGQISTFDVPNSTATIPAAMNAQDTITGVFKDSAGNEHGFVMSQSVAPSQSETCLRVPIESMAFAGDRSLSAPGTSAVRACSGLVLSVVDRSRF